MRRVIIKAIAEKPSAVISLARHINSAVSLPDIQSNYFASYDPEINVQRSKYADVQIPDLTFDQYIWRNLHKWQDKTAIECGITGRKYNYARLRDHSAAFAVRLQGHFRLRHGDTVAIMLPNVPEYAIATLGAMEAGLIVTTLNPSFTQYEITKQLSMTQPRVIVATPEVFEKVQRSCKTCAIRADILVVKTNIHQALPVGGINFTELVENTKNIDFGILEHSTERSIDDVCILPYSSGTTGLPKGVKLTHRNIVAHAEMLNAPRPIERYTRETTKLHQDRWLAIFPLFHMAGLMQSFLCNFSLGCKVITLPTVNPNQLLSTLMKYKPNLSVMVPPIVSLLAKNSRVCKDNHLMHIRSITCSGAPIALSDIEKLRDRAPNIEFLQVYGLTEASAFITVGHKNSSNYSTIGWPVSNSEMKIVDPNDPTRTGLPANRSGEILVRGPQVMQGYFQNEKATVEAITPDGWLRTGDMGWYDDEGFFYIKNRFKQLIKVHGMQVAPAELEQIIQEHPNVLDAGVIGIAHPTWGEVPRAFVVLKPGQRISEEEIMDYVADRVAKYKRIEGGVQFVPSIPRNPTGKILKKYLLA